MEEEKKKKRKKKGMRKACFLFSILSLVNSAEKYTSISYYFSFSFSPIFLIKSILQKKCSLAIFCDLSFLHTKYTSLAHPRRIMEEESKKTAGNPVNPEYQQAALH